MARTHWIAMFSIGALSVLVLPVRATAEPEPARVNIPAPPVGECPGGAKPGACTAQCPVELTDIDVKPGVRPVSLAKSLHAAPNGDCFVTCSEKWTCEGEVAGPDLDLLPWCMNPLLYLDGCEDSVLPFQPWLGYAFAEQSLFLQNPPPAVQKHCKDDDLAYFNNYCQQSADNRVRQGKNGCTDSAIATLVSTVEEPDARGCP